MINNSMKSGGEKTRTRKNGRGALTSRPGHQKGAVTMFTAILVLLLLTEMLIYAVQVGTFEQRKSGNEMRQKQAFHAAETGIQQAHAYVLAHAMDMTYGGTDGWLSRLCPMAAAVAGSNALVPTRPLTEHILVSGSHWIAGSPVNLRDSSYFFSLDGVNPSGIPLLVDEILPDSTETVTVQAVLCLLDIDRTPGVVPVKGCLLKDDPNVNDIYFVVTLLSRGQAECDAEGDCAAEALIAQKMGSFGPLSGVGGPGVPLTSRSSFPPGGTAEIVPNPNGAGTGVPVSAWLNDNPGLGCGADITSLDPDGGSWSTCERHEWYEVGAMPDENSP